MAVEMKVEIIARNTIKPSSPTPIHLRNFDLCFLDQLGPAAYGSLVFFYSFEGDTNHYVAAADHRSKKLKEWLSETLTRFYPLAGRIKDNICIDCNDYGAEYVEARVNCLLSSYLDQPYAEGLKQFLPIEIGSTEASTGRLLLVQASFFKCGGMAIGVCISHKLADGTTVSTFMKGWAATAHGYGADESVLPVFNAASVFPPRNFSGTLSSIFKPTIIKSVAKRFVFDASSIAALQAKAASREVKQPSRVEAVTALIWKGAMKASRSTSESSKPSVIIQSVNIRKRVVPQLPQNSIGNLVSCFAARAEENQIELQGLVTQLRKGMEQFIENKAKRLRSFEMVCLSFKETGSMITSEDLDFYIFTSVCRFGSYEIDFGWGKPTWVTIASAGQKNAVMLIDTKHGDGIEGWVYLSEEDMAFFERDQELLAFASSNPSPLKMSCNGSCFKPIVGKSSL